MEHITFFDVVVILFILFLGLKGIFRGFIKEAFSLVGLVGGIFIASRYGDELGNFIDKNLYHFQNHAALSLVGFLIVLAAFWIAAVLLGALFSSLVKESISILDRVFGFLVGILKVFFIVSIIIYIISSIDILKTNLEKYVSKSFLYPYLIKTGSYILKNKDMQREVKTLKTNVSSSKNLKEKNLSRETSKEEPKEKEREEGNETLNN